MTNKTLVLICTAPHTEKAKQAHLLTKEHLEQHRAVSVFFYGDGAYTANRLTWQSADVVNLTHAWAKLHDDFGLALPVCVSTALARGVVDTDNAKRHAIDGDNLHPAFELVGLADLAMAIDDDTHVIQFGD